MNKTSHQNINHNDQFYDINAADIIKADAKYLASTYKKFPIVIQSGKGSKVFDVDGKEYIDMGAGIAVSVFGIADEIWTNAVKNQLGLIQHTSNLYYNLPSIRLAELICERTGFSKVFFCNSGAEANECAIKIARKYAEDSNNGRSTTVMSLINSFHGRTLATLAATGQARFHNSFKPIPSGFAYAEIDDLNKAVSVATENNVCAIIIECIQGEGGMIPLDPNFIDGIYDYCKAKDVLLIVDEVQTGNGRTGKLYSFEHFEIIPDLFTTAKGLGGGLPIGACVIGEKVKDILGPGDHGSTFGGNPVCCAGAYSVLSRIDGGLLDEVLNKEKIVRKKLEGSKGIDKISGKGLMLGVSTKRDVAEIVDDCIDMGVLCITASDKLRITPALNIDFDLLEEALDTIAKACAKGL